MSADPDELRRRFIEAVRTDPYQATIVRMCADAWARGYEQARRDQGRPVELAHIELVERAYEEFVGHQAEREALAAAALLGRALDEAKVLAAMQAPAPAISPHR